MLLYNPTVSGSLLITGSLTTTGTLTAQTLVVQTITSSVDFVTGSSVNGSLSSNTHQFTGSVLVTGSGTFTSKLSINNPVSPYANGITVGGTGTGIMMYSTSTGSQTSIQIINASNYNYGTIGVVSGTGNIGGDIYGLGYTGNSNSTFTSVLNWTSTGSVSIGTTVSKATLQVSSILTGVPSIPSLGSTNGYVTTYFTNPNSLYGLLGGSLNSGNYWMQVQRTDGTAEAYNLLLQPNGGNVGIGKTPGSKLDIDGTITANKFTSAESVVAIPNSATTIFDATSQSGVWLVTAVVQGNGIQAGYAIVGLRSESTLYLLASGAGGQMTFSVSGATLRLSQSAGGTINTSISVMKINQGG